MDESLSMDKDDPKEAVCELLTDRRAARVREMAGLGCVICMLWVRRCVCGAVCVCVR